MLRGTHMHHDIISDLLMGHVYARRHDNLIDLDDKIFKESRKEADEFLSTLSSAQIEKINKIIAMYEEREFYNIGIAYKKGFKVGVIAGIEIGEEKDI